MRAASVVSPGLDSQFASIDLQDQRELPLARVARSSHVSLEVVRKQRTAGAAFTLACTASGLEDKEVYLPLEIDAGHFSRIKKGEAGFPPDKLHAFCQLVGNTIYPEWIAYQVGCGLVMLKSEAERRAEQAERERDAALAENRLMRDLLQGKP
jgi:hypothetical protein